MSAACRTGYVSRPWLTSSGWLSRFSLYVGVRSSHDTGVTVANSHISSVTSGRWLWTNSEQRSGSSPRARSEQAISRVRVRSASGSWVDVSAWKSTMQ